MALDGRGFLILIQVDPPAFSGQYTLILLISIPQEAERSSPLAQKVLSSISECQIDNHWVHSCIDTMGRMCVSGRSLM